MQLLSEEYDMLLELYRGLRQDLKRTLRLVPDHNTDELRGRCPLEQSFKDVSGALQNVMMLDKEEQGLVSGPFLAPYN